MTTNQKELVSDEELDQMIWKLERDGMTPKQLSLMRELREVRRAKGEPYGYVHKAIYENAGSSGLSNDHEAYRDSSSHIALYTVPSAPVVPDALPCPVFLEPGLKFGKGVRTQCMLDALNRRSEYHAELEAMTPEQRADHDAGIAEFKAMLSPGNSEQLEPVSNREELMPGIKPAPELDSVAKNAESLPGNSQAAPDGWVMVPVEPTPEMRDAYHNAQEEYESVDGLWSPDHQWKAMIAAAPKEVG